MLFTWLFAASINTTFATFTTSSGMATIHTGMTPLEVFTIHFRNTPLSESLPLLDARINQIPDIDARCNCKRWRNSLLPICRLPSEVLREIFMHCHEADILSKAKSRSRSYKPIPSGDEEGEGGRETARVAGHDSRLLLSWVCGLWRTRALSWPALWTWISIPPEKKLSPKHPIGSSNISGSHTTLATRRENAKLSYLKECVHRSGTHMDLSISLCSSSVVERILLSGLLKLGRIRDLEVNLTNVVLTKPLQGFWCQPAPHLASLTLVAADFCYIANAAMFTSSLFQRQYPMLQHLTLVDSIFRWNLRLLSASSLTSLRIISPRFSVSDIDLTQLLSKLPNLTRCSLSSCITKSYDQQQLSNHDHKLTIPKLRTLEIQDENAVDVFRLLDLLDIPHACVTIKVKGNHHLDIFSEPHFIEIFRLFAEYRVDPQHKWEDEQIRQLLTSTTKSRGEGDPARFTLIMSTSPARAMESSLDYPRKTFTIVANSLESHPVDSILTISSYLPFTRSSLQGVSLDVATPEILEIFQVSETSSLDFLVIGGMDMKLDDVAPLDEWFRDVEELVIGGRRYGSFQEFYDSRTMQTYHGSR